MKLRNLFLILTLLFTLQLKAQQPVNLPMFTFYKLNGTAFSNANLKPGKRNLFILFDCTCEHCQREIKQLNASFEQLKNLNLCMVSLDVASNINDFFKLYAPGMNSKPNVTVVRDTKQTFITSFLPSSYPSMYIYGADNKLQAYFYGDNAGKKILKAAGGK